MVPASVLQFHQNVTVVADEAALKPSCKNTLSFLPENGYPAIHNQYVMSLLLLTFWSFFRKKT
jgi:hypothetical protein